MTAAATASADDVRISARRSWLGFLTAPIFASVKILIGIVLCLTPVTAVLALGWLTRKTGRDIERALVRSGIGQVEDPMSWRWPNWVLLEIRRGRGRFLSLFGALWSNLVAGLGAFFGLALLTLPFSLLWLFSWWGGWENSFNKGYEQAWVGPVTGLVGVALAIVVLFHLPMALAHQAYERRLSAIVDIPRIRLLVRCAGWGNLWIAFCFVLAAVPLFALKGFPVFVENIYPPFREFGAEDVKGFLEGYRFSAAAYIFLVLIVLRGRIARSYAKAVLKSVKLDQGQWLGSRAGEMIGGVGLAGSAAPIVRRQRWLAWLVRTPIQVALWFGFIAMIFVGQFLNHSWWGWVFHPFLLLPWLPSAIGSA